MIKKLKYILIDATIIALGLMCLIVLGFIAYGALLFFIFAPPAIIFEGQYILAIPWLLILFLLALSIKLSGKLNKNEVGT